MTDGAAAEERSSFWCLSSSPQSAALRKSPRLGGGLETTDTYSSHFWRLEVQDQGARRIWCLVRAVFWVTDGCLFCVLTWQKG